eukprot:2173465-Lingulodinium_polyedra.AAC.1
MVTPVDPPTFASLPIPTHHSVARCGGRGWLAVTSKRLPGAARSLGVWLKEQGLALRDVLAAGGR